MTDGNSSAFSMTSATAATTAVVGTTAVDGNSSNDDGLQQVQPQSQSVLSTTMETRKIRTTISQFKSNKSMKKKAHLLNLLSKQLRYYFSSNNLSKDIYLKTIMELNSGFVPVVILSGFGNVRKIFDSYGDYSIENAEEEMEEVTSDSATAISTVTDIAAASNPNSSTKEDDVKRRKDEEEISHEDKKEISTPLDGEDDSTLDRRKLLSNTSVNSATTTSIKDGSEEDTIASLLCEAALLLSENEIESNQTTTSSATKTKPILSPLEVVVLNQAGKIIDEPLKNGKAVNGFDTNGNIILIALGPRDGIILPAQPSPFYKAISNVTPPPQSPMDNPTNIANISKAVAPFSSSLLSSSKVSTSKASSSVSSHRIVPPSSKNTSVVAENTIILRDIPESASEEDVRRIFEEEDKDTSSVSIGSVQKEIGNCWFVTLDSLTSKEDIITIMMSLKNKKILNEPIHARLKTHSNLLARSHGVASPPLISTTTSSQVGTTGSGTNDVSNMSSYHYQYNHQNYQNQSTSSIPYQNGLNNNNSRSAGRKPLGSNGQQVYTGDRVHYTSKPSMSYDNKGNVDGRGGYHTNTKAYSGAARSGGVGPKQQQNKASGGRGHHQYSVGGRSGGGGGRHNQNHHLVANSKKVTDEEKAGNMEPGPPPPPLVEEHFPTLLQSEPSASSLLSSGTDKKIEEEKKNVGSSDTNNDNGNGVGSADNNPDSTKVKTTSAASDSKTLKGNNTNSTNSIVKPCKEVPLSASTSTTTPLVSTGGYAAALLRSKALSGTRSSGSVNTPTVVVGGATGSRGGVGADTQLHGQQQHQVVQQPQPHFESKCNRILPSGVNGGSLSVRADDVNTRAKNGPSVTSVPPIVVRKKGSLKKNLPTGSTLLSMKSTGTVATDDSSADDKSSLSSKPESDKGVMTGLSVSPDDVVVSAKNLNSAHAMPWGSGRSFADIVKKKEADKRAAAK